MPVTAANTLWENWAQTATARPAGVIHPHDDEDLAAKIGRAAADGLRVRARGAGHSFSPVAVTDGVHVDLAHLAGLESVERRLDGTARVTVLAGTHLYHLHHLLAGHGLAMENLGDIDRQTLAGAISTGTHGTGLRFGGLATQVSGVRLVTADGTVRSVSVDDPPGSPARELFEVARLGLGSVGVLTAITIEAVPAFWLRSAERPEPLGAFLADPDAFARSADHAELYWFPGTQRIKAIRNDRLSPQEAAGWATDRSGLKGRLRLLGQEARGLLDDEVIANGLLEVACRVTTAAPGLTGAVGRLATHLTSSRDLVAPSYQVYCHKRRVRFREMEYAVPRAVVGDVMRELVALHQRTGEPVAFPVEVRFAAADDVWLSTARERETAYIAVHQYLRMPYRRWFDNAERVFVAAGGRPHWGKMHRQVAADLAEHYPLDDVARVRAAVDPGRVFSNDYADAVLGTAST